jgi:Rapamycin-insensitive companion of mTOR, middle domain
VEICVIEAPDLLEELLTDLYTCLVAVKETPNADIIFNALKILYLCVADYFIFVGRISSSVAGEHFLVKKKIFAVFMDFISQQDIHECYIKLIVTTLDYGKTENGIERALFEKIVTSGSPVSRISKFYLFAHMSPLTNRKY